MPGGAPFPRPAATLSTDLPARRGNRGWPLTRTTVLRSATPAWERGPAGCTRGCARNPCPPTSWRVRNRLPAISSRWRRVERRANRTCRSAASRRPPAGEPVDDRGGDDRVDEQEPEEEL